MSQLSQGEPKAEGFYGIGAARADGDTPRYDPQGRKVEEPFDLPAEPFAPNERDSRGNPVGVDAFSGKDHS